MMLELKSAVRSVLRSWRMSLAAVVCIALGAASVSAVASLLFAALLRPLPFPEPERLTRVWLVEEGSAERAGVAFADVADLRAEVTAFERVEAALRARLIFLSDDGGRRVEGEAVTDGYFELVGARLARGRWFTPAEHAGSGAPVMLLSHDAWGALYAYSETAVGSTVRSPDAVYTVVGVLAESFGGTIEEDSDELEFWVPASPYVAGSAEQRGGGEAWVLARRARGSTLGRAQSEVSALGERIASEHPRVRSGTALRAEPMSESWRAGLRDDVLLLFGAAALLLLVAATNVAGLMLARGLAARREIAVRMALGAGRWPVVRLLALEATILAIVGAVVGLALGPLCLRAFAAIATVPVPSYVRLEAAPTAMAIAALAVGASTIVAALVPAMLASGVHPMAAIRAGGRGAAVSRDERYWTRALVIGEVAITTVLVSSTALLLRSYQALGEADLGFRTERMLRVALFVNTQDAPADADVPQLQHRAHAAIAAQPGVEAVARLWPTIPIVAPVRTPVSHAGMDARRPVRAETAAWYAADPALFELLGIRLVAGRVFEESDHADAEPVAVISESFARRLGGAHAALDQVIRAVGAERRVVGVVADAAFSGPRAHPQDQVQLFTPLAQTPNRLVSFAVRTTGDDPRVVLPAVRRALARVAPASALDWTDSYTAAFGEQFATDRFVLALTATFATVTLVLAALGLFAVLAYTVARRRVEIGVRQALGATRRRLVAQVIGGALALVLAGFIAGAILALASNRVLAGLLYGIERLDPAAFASTGVVVLLTALAASAWPARLASRVEPAIALRNE